MKSSLEDHFERSNLFSPRPELLLCPNVPSPMHGVAPRNILGGRWWNETRRAAYKSTQYRCAACGVHKAEARLRRWLEGHERYEIDYAKGRMTYIETVPLCHCCHHYIHDGRLIAMKDSGKITHYAFATIMRHGHDVLLRAGLRRLSRRERVDEMANMLLGGLVAPWESWRLVLLGIEYPPKFRTEAHWRKALGK